MNYKAVFLPLPVIELREGNNKVITISKKSRGISSNSIPNYANIDTTTVKIQDLRYRTVDYVAVLKRNSVEIDSATTKGPMVNIGNLMKVAKKGDTIIFKISRAQRMNYENKIEDIPLNVEFEYPVLE
ncbi:GldM family protein [Bernardetia sp. OM2101]|uniref:GldM family protein n=1 Tax=Bernardetia sp. OM2101 TaxID=3344876 RepID=UPI0035CF1B72